MLSSHLTAWRDLDKFPIKNHFPHEISSLQRFAGRERGESDTNGQGSEKGI